MNDQGEKAVTLRSLFNFKKNRPSISIDEVESAANIYKRFATGAMSFGSISWEAHTTLAVAMNRLGGKTIPAKAVKMKDDTPPLENGDSMRSAIKQVASARFGVTSLYLTEADELQIKWHKVQNPAKADNCPGIK